MPETITDTQKEIIAGLIAQALETSHISYEEANDAIKKGPDLQSALQHLIKDPTWARTKLVYNDYHYPPGFNMGTVEKQTLILKNLFPELDYSQIPELAENWEIGYDYEGLAVIPKPDIINAQGYNQAIIQVLGLLKKEIEKHSESLWIKVVTENSIEKLILHERTEMAHKELNKQPGDFWVFPAQLGKIRQGCSLQEVVHGNHVLEFPLGLYEGIILWLTHMDRLISTQNAIDIGCGGSVFKKDPRDKYFYYFAFGWDQRIDPDDDEIFEVLALFTLRDWEHRPQHAIITGKFKNAYWEKKTS